MPRINWSPYADLSGNRVAASSRIFRASIVVLFCADICDIVLFRDKSSAFLMKNIRCWYTESVTSTDELVRCNGVPTVEKLDFKDDLHRM